MILIRAESDHCLALSQCPARVDIESSRSEKWNENLFHSFREVKSEMKIWFTLFEKWKVKWKSDSLFSRSEKWNKNLIHSFREVKSEMKMPRDRDREVKFLENSKFLENFREFPENQKRRKLDCMDLWFYLIYPYLSLLQGDKISPVAYTHRCILSTGKACYYNFAESESCIFVPFAFAKSNTNYSKKVKVKCKDIMTIHRGSVKKRTQWKHVTIWKHEKKVG